MAVDTDEHSLSLHEQPPEVRAKYTAKEIEAMGEKGQAFKNSDGSYSYPIGDEEDLKNAIHAVGRGNADHDAIRKYIIGRADDLGLKSEIPDNWNSDGSLKEDDDESKSLQLRAAGDNCNRCDGEGSIDLDGETVECPQCNGTGSATNNAESQAAMESCPTCDGSGKIKGNSTTCPTCGGSGEVEKKSRIPAVAAVRSEYRNMVETRVSTRSEFELKEIPNGTGGTNLRFTGFGSVTDAEYGMEDFLGPWTESVSKGAFAKTLGEGADVAFLLNHGGMTLARTKPGTLKLSEVTEGNRSPVYGVTGLHSEALLDPKNMYVLAMRSAVDRGDLDEMSFAFRVLRQEWNDDYSRRWINEVNLDKGDVSLVNYGANPTTGGTVAIRQKLFHRSDDLDVGRVLYVVRHSALFDELRAGKAISAANSTQLQKALDALHAADDADIPGIVKALQGIDAALDDAQGAVSTVLGVKDPDGDPADLEPTLSPPPDSKSLPPLTGRAMVESLRYRRVS